MNTTNSRPSLNGYKSWRILNKIFLLTPAKQIKEIKSQTNFPIVIASVARQSSHDAIKLWIATLRSQ